jgi:hypothetical protein
MHLAVRLAFLVVVAQTLCASPQRVALVQGTSSMPNAAERRYAVSVTRRLSRWLNEIPISHTTLTDNSLTPQSLQHVDVLILGYNPLPTPSMLSVLERYLDRGGKLIVFYGANPKLAYVMGVRLGKYMGAT